MVALAQPRDLVGELAAANAEKAAVHAETAESGGLPMDHDYARRIWDITQQLDAELARLRDEVQRLAAWRDRPRSRQNVAAILAFDEKLRTLPKHAQVGLEGAEVTAVVGGHKRIWYPLTKAEQRLLEAYRDEQPLPKCPAARYGGKGPSPLPKPSKVDFTNAGKAVTIFRNRQPLAATIQFEQDGRAYVACEDWSCWFLSDQLERQAVHITGTPRAGLE